jgi:glycosyltransferase involved in cell wall biosynthesis
VHAYDIFLHRFMMREKVADAALVACISAYNIRFLRETDGVEGEQIHLVRCGVDLAEFPFVERAAGGNPFRVLAVGRLHEMKGFIHLVRASGLLRGRFPFQVEIVGEGPEGAALASEIRALGVANEVRILSRIGHAELLDSYRTADAFVLPCLRQRSGNMDGIPATLMEAMASGMPVITTGISGIPELVEDGVTGLLVPPSDPAALARAIERLRAEPDLLRSLSRAGRRRVEESYDIRRNAAELGRRIETIVAAAPVAAPVRPATEAPVP